MTTANATKTADHYIVEWTYWATTKREQFETLNDAMAKREQEVASGSYPVAVTVIFTDGTSQTI